MTMNSEMSVPARAKPWVVIADHARARFFTVQVAEGPLVEEAVLTNPDARLHEGDFVSAARGHLVGGKRSAQGGGHAAADDHSAKQHSSDGFARSVSASLRKARLAGAIARLYLIAEPGFLGELRKHMDESTRRLVVSQIDRSFTDLVPAQIREHLPSIL